MAHKDTRVIRGQLAIKERKGHKVNKACLVTR